MALLESGDVDTVDCAAGIICNLVHVDKQYLGRLLQAGVIEKMVKAMARKDEIGMRLVHRLPMLCKYLEARKVLKAKTNRSAIVRFTKNQIEDGTQTIAQSIVRVLDA
jgi:hypothetical protein